MMHQSHINRPYDPERGTGVPRRRFIANVCLALQSATGKRSGWVCRDRQGSPATLRRGMNSTPETPGIGIEADSCRTPNRRERLTADNCPVANLPNAAWAARRALRARGYRGMLGSPRRLRKGLSIPRLEMDAEDPGGAETVVGRRPNGTTVSTLGPMRISCSITRCEAGGWPPRPK